jgi:DNA-binding transcriptional regulator YiaG
MKPTPIPGWIATRITYPVRIPNLDGDGFAETVEIEIDAWKNADGEIFLDGDGNDLIEKTRARHMGLIVPEDIRELRERLELTQEQISDLLQIGKKTWTRWETGKERPSRSMNLLLHAIYDGKVDMNYLRIMREPTLRHKVIQPQRPMTGRDTYSYSAERQACDESIMANG